MNEPRKMLFDTNIKSSLESENRRAYDTAFKISLNVKLFLLSC